MSTTSREEKLWCELTKEEKAEEKREFLESYCLECGGVPEDYVLYWEQYLNHEGWTARDERIIQQRDEDFKFDQLLNNMRFHWQKTK